MKWKDYSQLEGKHAFLSGSKYHWINYDSEKLIQTYENSVASEVGTVIHDAAKYLIEGRISINENDEHLIRYILESNGMPRSFPTDRVLENLIPYVNDAIDYGMQPEQILYYSDFCFGCADTISFNKDFLRIHDLKTGTTPAHMEQLMVYAALFCLNYKHKPGDIKMELRIYQNGEVLYFNPTPEDIVPIMNTIVSHNKILEKIKAKEEA